MPGDPLQVTRVLLMSAPITMSARLLAIPCALQHIMDCLLERETLRDEALHLLTALTTANRQAAGMVAFEVAPRGSVGWFARCTRVWVGAQYADSTACHPVVLQLRSSAARALRLP